MGRFPLPLNVQLLDGGELARLLTEFMYHDPNGPSVRVPAGFETDFASVRPLRNIAVGYGHAAATIHDRLYATGELSRYWSDRVFYHALRASGVARWRARLMYAGVRIGGHWRYSKQ